LEYDRFLLRKKLFYPKKLYYFAIVVNFILRFSWIFTLLPIWWFTKTFTDVQAMVLLLTFAEVFRRTLWSFFRVENENINNYEKYRVILEIPKLPEEDNS